MPAGEIRHLDHNSPHGQERHECGSSAGLDWTKTKEHDMTRRFKLVRNTDVTGVSGTGHVADGLAFDDGVVVLRWRSEWPTSVVFHDRGIEAVEKIHGHGGATRIQWLDVVGPPAPEVTWDDMWTTLTGYVQAAIENPKPNDAALIAELMRQLQAERRAPIKAWMDNIRNQPAS